MDTYTRNNKHINRNNKEEAPVDSSIKAEAEYVRQTADKARAFCADAYLCCGYNANTQTHTLDHYFSDHLNNEMRWSVLR